MPEYINPTSFLPDPSQFQVEGRPNVWSGMVAAQRQQQAAPFLDMARQQMQQQTATGQQTLEEFLSPKAQEARTAQRQQLIDEGDVYSRTKDDKVAREKEKTRLDPWLTDQQIEQAKLGAVQARHAVASEPIKYFSGAWEHLQNIPEEHRPAVYNTLVKTSGYDVNKLPADLQTYQPSTMSHLAMARYAQVHTPEQEQKIAQEQVPAQAQRDVANINVKGAITRTKMELDAGKYDNVDRLTGHLEEVVRTGLDPVSKKPVDEATKLQAQQTLRRLRSAKLMDAVNKDSGVQAAQMGVMAAAFSNDPRQKEAARASLNQAYEDAHERVLKLSGLRPEDLGLPQQQQPKQQAPKQVKVGGEILNVVKTNPDGTVVVNKNGREIVLRPKQ